MASDDVEARYHQSRLEFSRVLQYAVHVSITLARYGDTDERGSLAKRIFAKMLAHALSLERLSPTGLKPADNRTQEIWDLSSLCCICRALIEAFDALAYIALEETTSEEFEFRTTLWRLHAEDRKLQALQLIGSEAPGVAEAALEVEKLRERLQKCSFLNAADASVRTEVLGKKIPAFHIRAPERNRRSGVNHAYYTSLYILLSAHTHTHPLAIQHISQFRAGDLESLRYMSLPTQYSIGFLSKATSGMTKLFAGQVPPCDPDVDELIGTWSAIVENGLPGTSTR